MTERGASGNIPRMATRQVSVAKAVTGAHAHIVGSTTVTVPITITSTPTTSTFQTAVAPVYTWLVPAGTYTTLAALVIALNASTPVTGPSLASILTFAATGTALKVTFTRESSTDNGQNLTGFVMTQVHLAGVNASGGVTPVRGQRLWQTTSAVSPDPTVTKTTGIYQAGTPSDPVPITIENLSGTNDVWIAQGGEAAPTVTKTTGERLGHGASKAYSVRGNDQVYAVATTATATVSVSVGRQ